MNRVPREWRKRATPIPVATDLAGSADARVDPRTGPLHSEWVAHPSLRDPFGVTDPNREPAYAPAHEVGREPPRSVAEFGPTSKHLRKMRLALPPMLLAALEFFLRPSTVPLPRQRLLVDLWPPKNESQCVVTAGLAIDQTKVLDAPQLEASPAFNRSAM